MRLSFASAFPARRWGEIFWIEVALKKNNPEINFVSDGLSRRLFRIKSVNSECEERKGGEE